MCDFLLMQSNRRQLLNIQSVDFEWVTLMHRFPDSAGFGQKMQEAELSYLMSSKAAQTTWAENYVGLRG
jgi:p-hydroxybenzoate 3-monooxygenase